MTSHNLGCAVHVKEINYDQHQWQLNGNVKVIALLMNLLIVQMSVARRTANICHSLNPLNLFLPPLHIKQGLMKSSLKAVDKQGQFSFTSLQSSPN